MSFKTKVENGCTDSGITYTVGGDARYAQYVSMPMETHQMTTLEQLAGYAIKEEASGLNNKVYMVLDGASGNETDSVVVGPNMPNLENFNDEDHVKAYTDTQGGNETVYYVVGSDNTLTEAKGGKTLMVGGEQMQFVEEHVEDEEEDEEDAMKARKKKKKSKTYCMKDEGPETKYPPLASSIPESKRGLRHKMSCKHCKLAYQEEISLLTSHYCGYCDFGTYEIDALNTHIRHEHPLDKKSWFIKCRQCSYSTVCKSNMKYHNKITHDTSNTFYCSICEFNCVIKKDYYNHVIEEHTGDRFFKCEFCLYRNSSENEVTRHMNALHPDQINYMA